MRPTSKPRPILIPLPYRLPYVYTYIRIAPEGSAMVMDVPRTHLTHSQALCFAWQFQAMAEVTEILAGQV